METGQLNNSPAVVMDALEGVASSMGMRSKLDNQIWKSFKQQDSQSVIPHAMKLAKEMGIMPKILSMFGGSK